jgi:hypothetical protein
MLLLVLNDDAGVAGSSQSAAAQGRLRPRRCKQGFSRKANRRLWRWWAVALLIVTSAVFCHGCHGDEDTELLTGAFSRHQNWSGFKLL